MIGEAFDRELSLLDLTRGIRLQPIAVALDELVGAPVRLVDLDGSALFGPPVAVTGARRQSLRIELEPVGFLEADAAEPRLKAAATLLRQILMSSARYVMASDLHLQSVHADYEELQEKHRALQESEARYRALATELEVRVEAQVRTIETAQRQLYQAERLSSMGRLAAGVAHEINNPMGFVRSNLGTAESYVDELRDFERSLEAPDLASAASGWRAAKLDLTLGDFHALLRESIEGVDRVSRIVANLKRFSSVDRSEEENVDLNDTIRAVCEIAEAQAGRKLEVDLKLAPLPQVPCRPGDIAQALMHLMVNAAQAYHDKDTATVRVRSAQDGDHVVVTIDDSGCGVPEVNLPRLFDPFFTTREVGTGTGLGLTVCRDVVLSHGGTIEVTSEVGKGTRVTLRLPVRS